MRKQFKNLRVKGIVSRDWGGLQTILLDRLEILKTSTSTFFYIRRRFHIEFLKMAAPALLHFNIARQMTSTLPGTLQQSSVIGQFRGFIHAQ